MNFQTHPVTYTLIAMNALMHLLVIFTDHLSILNINFMQYKLSLIPEIMRLHHEWWRFLSSIFVHSNFLHLLANMIALLIFGHIMEPVLGHKRYILIYLAGGLSANLVAYAYAVYFGPVHYMALGASGAVLAILGAALALFWIAAKNKSHGHRTAAQQMLRRMLVIVLLQVAADMINTQSSFIHHISGLITGLILAIVLCKDQRTSFHTRYTR